MVGASPLQDEFASVTVDDGDGFVRIGRYLLELGHREIAVVSGPETLVRTQARVDGLGGIVLGAGGRLVHEATTGSAEAAAGTTRRLMTGRRAPTAIVYDSDLAAIAALDVARRSGLTIPWDLSVVAASDSALCRLSTPSVTALPATQHALGTAAGEVLIDVLDGDRTARRHVEVGGLAVRGSTGPRSR